MSAPRAGTDGSPAATPTARLGSAANGGWPEVAGLPRLVRGLHVHLVGIGGAGMSGLARVLHALGVRVTGSDRSSSPLLASLAELGMEVWSGHDPSRLSPAPALLVRSPAVPEDDPEVAAARAAGVPVAKRADLLGALIDERDSLAVAGTHGKSTTSGMLALMLIGAGLDPTFLIGADVVDLGTNAGAGHGRHLVVEADEYDRTFLHGHPLVAVITSIEHDHPDIYPTLGDVEEAFAAFVGMVRPGGLVVARWGVPSVERALAGSGVPVRRFALEGDAGGDPATGPGAAEWIADEIRDEGDGSRFVVRPAGREPFEQTLRVPGRHNVANALAALAAADAAGVDAAAASRSLAAFRGVGRRYDLLGRARHVTVVDDYAHHPTEIRAAVAAARARTPGRVWAVAEPHTYSRVAALAPEFGAALSTADRVVVTPVYAAREEPMPGIDAAAVAREVPGAEAATSLADAAERAARGATAGDTLLFLGAGDIVSASRLCMERLVDLAARDLRSAALAAGLGGAVDDSAPLAPHTSLKVGGPARLLVRVTTTEDLAGWWRLAAEIDVPVRVLGRGSNVLCADEGFGGLVLLNRCEAWTVAPHATEPLAGLVEAESGVTLAALAHQLARAGWAGIEAGAGIPGSVGAAVVGNAGAHGWSTAESLLWADVLGPGGVERLAAADLSMGYRRSLLHGDRQRVVLRAALRVRRDEPAAIAARIADQAARRRATQPSTPSAGSMFRNPPGDYAGRLIEAAGLKGTAVGGARISPVHANFFVNEGGATAADVQALVARARREVLARFGVDLQLEIEPLGGRDAPVA